MDGGVPMDGRIMDVVAAISIMMMMAGGKGLPSLLVPAASGLALFTYLGSCLRLNQTIGMSRSALATQIGLTLQGSRQNNFTFALTWRC